MAQQTSVTTDGGRVFLERAAIDGLASNATLTHLAIGDAPVPKIAGVLQKPAVGLTALGHEIGRAFYAERYYVVADPAGAIVLDTRYRRVPGPTNLVYFRFLIPDNEAMGGWTELALIGGGVTLLDRGATLVDLGFVGDDRANRDVLLSGGYSPTESQRITITCSLGGGAGVAKVGWVSTGSVAAENNINVPFGTPLGIAGSGLALTFSGGADAVLTQGAQWEIRGTRAAVSASYAAHGVYDPALNQAGQVLVPGTVVRALYMDPPEPKGVAAVNVAFVAEVVHT